jgi:DNA repair protein RadC
MIRLREELLDQFMAWFEEALRDGRALGDAVDDFRRLPPGVGGSPRCVVEAHPVVLKRIAGKIQRRIPWAVVRTVGASNAREVSFDREAVLDFMRVQVARENPYPPPPPERIMLIRNPRRKKPTLEMPLGDYEHMRVRLGLVRDPHWQGPTEPIGGSRDVYNAVRTMGIEPVEAMYVVLLDSRHRIIGLHEVARGGVTSAAIEPAALLQSAVVTGAPAIILVHNHPSGSPEPSSADEMLTRALEGACKVLGIRLLDHLVVGDGYYVSLADRGMM